MKRSPWNDTENAALVALYFAMLDHAVAGKPYNKARMIRSAQKPMTHEHDTLGPLRTRSRGSIEAKLMNATACHRALAGNVITMDGHGYRALSNYQKSLKSAMQSALNSRSNTRAAQLQSLAS